MDYAIYILSGCVIYGIIALGYGIALGYTGLLSVGHAGIVAAGAYTAGILATKLDMPFGVAIAAAGVAGMLVGLLLSLPSDRIRSDYYALVTIGFLFLTNAFALNVTSLTNGPFGITGIMRPEGFADASGFLFLLITFLLIAGVVAYRILHTPFGRALEAVRDDAELAASLGKPTMKLRMVAMALSGAFTGVGGGLLAYFLQVINPQVFWIDMAVLLVSMLVVGGLASFWGTLAGSAVIYLLYEPFRFLPLPSAYIGPLRVMLYSLVVILVILFRPKGIMGRAYLDE